jgi:hypothetical protein
LRWGRVTILLAAVAVASLNAILLLGAAGPDLGAPPGLLGSLVLALDVSLVASSLLLGVGFARRGHGWLAALFLGNVAVFLAAAVLRASGITFRPAALFAADLYWLHLYLIVLTRHWRRVIGPDA